jgi:N-acetyl-beta-hexosaminidase
VINDPDAALGKSSNANNQVTIDLKQEDRLQQRLQVVSAAVTVGTAVSLVDATILASIPAIASRPTMATTARRLCKTSDLFATLAARRSVFPIHQRDRSSWSIPSTRPPRLPGIVAQRARVHQSLATSVGDRCGG